MRPGLVRLYPQDWRVRYGDEFEAMLEAQPTNPGNVADVVLGALDAHLTSKSPENRGWWLRKLPGLLITAGALVWTAAAAVSLDWGSQGGPLENVWAQFWGIAVAGIGLGCLAEASLRRGASRFRWLSSGLAGSSLLLMAAMGWILLSLSGSLTEVLAPFYGPVVLGCVVAQLVWASAMTLRSPEHRLALAALAVAVLLNLTLGHVVWQSASAAPLDAGVPTPAYPPAMDRLLGLLYPASWTLVGLSVLRPRRWRPLPSREADPAEA